MPEDKKQPPPLPLGTVRLVERSSVRPHRDHRRPSESDANPEFVNEEYTDKYDGEELRQMRAKRPTRERLDRLELARDRIEERMDERHAEIRQEIGDVRKDVSDMRKHVGELAVAVGNHTGQFEVIPDLIDAMKDATKALREREHVTFTAKVDVEKAKETAKVDVETAKAKDEIAAKGTKREWITKGLTIVSSIVAVISTAIAAGRC